MTTIDLNSDIGESFGVYRLGADAEVLRYVSSANIACGFHAGDAQTMADTVAAALSAGVAVGAHPGLNDLIGFGRRTVHLNAREAYNITLYQIGALKVFVEAAGGRLAHVKAHGALYNQAAKDEELARALCKATATVDSKLVFFGLPGSKLVSAAHEFGLTVANEVFADRTYQDDGSLTPRSKPDAMITDANVAMRQVMDMLNHGIVTSTNGVAVKVQADTLCIHGDSPGAAEFARDLREALDKEGVVIRAPASRH